MCGIVAYIGPRNAIPILIEGIKRLEYRGYDSAGLAIIAKSGELLVEKKEGKIIDLERSISWDPRESQSTIGISHTRWATHGEPTTINAHPHINTDRKIALVHNGIIENYKYLKEHLIANGQVFLSDTDTEVLVQLIDYFYKKAEQTEQGFFASIQQALKRVEGTYGIAVINQDFPHLIVAARKGSPVIVGIGKNENFITSDINAIIIHTNKVIYLEDGELIKVNSDSFELSTINNETRQGVITQVDLDISAIDKGSYKHFMLKEIFEQPTTVFNAFRGRLAEDKCTSHMGGLSIQSEAFRRVKKIQLIGCGTSWHAGIVGKYIIEHMSRVPVDIEYASEFRYRNPIVPEDTIVFTISQSGETADTLAALKEAKTKGALVCGITNVVGSSIARETDCGIYIHAGSEIGVASTKAFTSQITVLFLLGLMLGRMRHMSLTDGSMYISELKKIPDKIQQILDKNDTIIQIAQTIKDTKNALYLGRGFEYPVALEGALKLKEISYIHAEGYPAAEMKHGPIALIDQKMPVVAICPKDFLYEKISSNLQEVKARQGRIIAIATEGDTEISQLADQVIYIPDTLPVLRPLLTVIPLQLLAYHVANLKGLNVDQPRNLAKSVTVE